MLNTKKMNKLDSTLTVITNNPLVRDKYSNVIYVYGGPLQVIDKVLQFLEKGYLLHSHPISGSIRLSCNPYRSILVSKKGSGGQIDKNGIKTILVAIDHIYKSINNRPTPKVFLYDYAELDLELLEKTVTF